MTERLCNADGVDRPILTREEAMAIAKRSRPANAYSCPSCRKWHIKYPTQYPTHQKKDN